MTIEAILQEQTEILKDQNLLIVELLKRLTGSTTMAAVEGKPVPKAEAKEAPKAEPKAAATKAAEPKAEPPKAETKAEAPVEEAQAQAVTYDDVKKAVTALVIAKGRDVGIEVLNGLGVKSATELRAEQWPLAIDACKAALV